MNQADPKAQVERIHAEYCAITGRQVPVRLYERAWFDLLRSPEYTYNAEKLLGDVKLLVRYLKRMISLDKRNPGALKLSNFLQPDKFLEDVAEARASRTGSTTRRPLEKKTIADDSTTPVPREEGARRLREFRVGR